MARRRKRRGKVVVVAVVVLALWALLGGPGLSSGTGEKGSGGEGSGEGAGERPGVAVRQDSPVPRERALADPAADPAAGRAEREPDVPPAAAPSAAARTLELAETDRLEGFLHDLREAVAAGRLGAACAALDGANELVLETPSLVARREAEGRELDRVINARVAELTEAVAAGRVAEAREQLGRLRDPPHAAVERVLARDLEARGWNAWSASDATGGARPAGAAALERGRRVRAPFRGGWSTGRVVGAAGEEVTVEVRTSDGLAYAFVPRTSIEPVSPTAAESADQGIAALLAGDPVLAAMWLCHARGAGSPDPGRLSDLEQALK